MKKCLLVLMTMLAFGIARAEEPKKADSPKPDTKTDTGALTPEKLGAMLRDLGYEPKDVSVDKKKDIYEITTESNGWKVYITVSLSSDRTLLWLDVNFNPIANTEASPTAAWLKLLELSHENDPIHFTLDDKNRIHVAMPQDNHGITPVALRKTIENFDAVVRQTAPYWKADNFKPQPKPKS